MTEEDVAEKLVLLAERHGFSKGKEYLRWAREALRNGRYGSAVYWARAELRASYGQDMADLIAAGGGS